jgi:hypothetical protein
MAAPACPGPSTAAVGWPADGQLSEDEFEMAALEFSLWWQQQQQQQQQQQEQQQQLPPATRAAGSGTAGGGLCAPEAWLWVRHVQPLTGEARGYLSAEVVLPPAVVTPLRAAAAAPAAAPPAGRAAAHSTRSGGGDSSSGDNSSGGGGTPFLSDEEDEATVRPAVLAAVAGSVAAAAASAAGTQEAGGGGGRALGHAVELHIAYHATYRVPLLLFRARRLGRGGGGLHGSVSGLRTAGASAAALTHEELLRLLDAPLARHADVSVPGWAYVTQLAHPVLGQPWAALHPCRTSELIVLMLAPGTGAEEGGGGFCSNISSSGASRRGGGGGLGGTAAEAPPTRQSAPLRYLVAWFSVAARAVGVRTPAAPPGDLRPAWC